MRDPNETMHGYAAQRARAAGVSSVEWVHGSDADLSSVGWHDPAGIRSRPEHGSLWRWCRIAG
jgi:hypothetical protein